MAWVGLLGHYLLMQNLLLIDLDNTLIDRSTGFERWAQAFLCSIGRYSEEEMRWLHSQDRDGTASRKVFFNEARTRYGLPHSTDTLVARYQSAIPSFIPPPTHDTLIALREARQGGYKVCIVTNGSRRTQEPKITADLANAVDGWVISEVVGARKPDPAILLSAAECVRQAVTVRSWLIGDRPESDILCASRAGILSAWVKRDQDWDGTLSYRPTVEVRDVSEAVQRILST